MRIHGADGEIRTLVPLLLDLYRFSEVFVLFPLDLCARCALVEVFANVSELFLLTVKGEKRSLL